MVVLDDGGVVVSWGVLRVTRFSKVVTVVVCFQTLRICTLVLNIILFKRFFGFFWQFELVRVLLVHVTWSAISLTVFTLKITCRMGNRGCKTRGSDISDCQYSLLNQVDLLTATSGPGFILR